ncbi:hypothetical protein B5G34_00525 [Flavonifractor sp. An82]|uniref:hypothetical protein n=1 Tax=Flavonifractor sp. An82 TaxID=1965660 RepID=UPI000B3928AE|nr:hypothetical protein [Flavonifractor sp. An82]OUN23618.1 hypothetical protein B5G34_00525 [Flavonifractor sp. An82]
MRRFRCIKGDGYYFTPGLVYTLNKENSVDGNRGSTINRIEYETGIEWLERMENMKFEELPEE